MLSFLLIYLGITVIAAALLIYFIVKSPEGWEDNEGFHYSDQKENFVTNMKFSENVMENGQASKIFGHS